MRTTMRSGDLLLRTLIKEYVMNYKLPTIDRTSATAGNEKDSMTSKLFKAGLVTIAAFGFNEIFGDEGGTNDKNPLDSFATNVSNAAGILTSGTDTTDIITALGESSGLGFLLEKEDVFVTNYGQIKSDLIDKVLITNIRAAQNKRYFSFPTSVKVDTPSNFKASLQAALSEVRGKSNKLFSIVNADLQTKVAGFTGDFNQFGLTLADVDGLSDVSSTDNEINPANAAMSDAVSTAIYNQMKYEIITFIGGVDEAYKAGVTDKKRLPEYKKVLNDIVKEFSDIMTPSGNARLILLKP